MAISTFYQWFPVIPFLVYWISSFFLYEFGPFVNPELDEYTYLYLAITFFLFVVYYKKGLKSRYAFPQLTSVPDNEIPYSILNWSTIFTLIGTALLLFDRINSGAGSLDLVMNNLQDVRGYYSDRTTILTTVAVIPQSFRLVSFSSYFFCLLNKAYIPTKIHVFIFAIMGCELYSMVLSANRGTLFWLSTYFIFYLMFCKQISMRELFLSSGYRKLRIVIVSVLIMSLSYFYFIGKNRDDESTLRHLGSQVSSISRYSFALDNLDDKSIGAAYQLFTYGTDEFKYINAYVKNADILSFDPIAALGLRVYMQIKRIWPEYESSARTSGVEWLHSERLSIYGWASTFGWPLAMFGFLGAFVFFGTLGYLCGSTVKKYLHYQSFGWFILVFTSYASLNMSFDWILKDFEQFMAVFVAVALIRNKRYEYSEPIQTVDNSTFLGTSGE